MTPNISIVIIRCQDTYWVHQRSSTKRIYPLLWGIGIGGKSEIHETPYDTATRELFEETGIQVEAKFLQRIGDFSWADESIAYHGTLFVCDLKDAFIPRPCDKEFAKHIWISTDQVTNPSPDMHFCPDSLYFWHRFLPLILSKSPFSNC